MAYIENIKMQTFSFSKRISQRMRQQWKAMLNLRTRTAFTIYIFVCLKSTQTKTAHWMTQSDITCKVIIFHQEDCCMFPNKKYCWANEEERKKITKKCVMKFHLPKFFRFPYSVGKVETKPLFLIIRLSEK